MRLPEGWAESTIEEIAAPIPRSIIDGPFGSALKSEHYTGGGARVIRLNNIAAGRFNPGDAAFVSMERFEALCAHEATAGDLVTAALGEPLGRTCFVPEGLGPAIVKADCFRTRLSDEVDHDFILAMVNSPSVRQSFVDRSRGIGRIRINLEVLRSTSLPLPPLNEQRRIVAKLGALSARLIRARAELDRARVLAASLRLAALRATFHWTEAGLPAGWERKRIDEIGSVQLGRQRSPKDHAGPHMRPYVRAANITWSGWDLSDVKEMNFSPDEFEAFSLRPGDVLLNEGSGSAKEVGKPVVWNGEIEGACFQNTLLRVRPQGYLPELLRYSLLYVALSGQFIQNTKGVNIIHIGKAGLARTVIPVPPSEEQPPLLEALNTAFARADRLEAEAARARALLDRLEAAILAKAFRGELVSQDPNDEPAGVLLDRIRTHRAAAPAPKRSRRRARTTDRDVVA